MRLFKRTDFILNTVYWIAGSQNSLANAWPSVTTFLKSYVTHKLTNHIATELQRHFKLGGTTFQGTLHNSIEMECDVDFDFAALTLIWMLFEASTVVVTKASTLTSKQQLFPIPSRICQ